MGRVRADLMRKNRKSGLCVLLNKEKSVEMGTGVSGQWTKAAGPGWEPPGYIRAYIPGKTYSRTPLKMSQKDQGRETKNKEEDKNRDG